MKILIIYQHRVREYDNALLLKVVLEKRGHRVEIKHDAAQMSLFRRYDLYLFPCLYNNSQLDFLTYRFNVYNRPVINMRYEQVSTQYDYESGSMAPQEKAKEIPAINWGRFDFNYCRKFGMKEELLNITGHITMDFLRKDFADFWYSKEEIASMFQLDSKKKWVLFISTLAYAEDNEELAKSAKFFGDSKELNAVARAHNETRKELLCWVDRLLTKEDVCFIYRPHPAERTEGSEQIAWMLKKHDKKFFVIERLNIKQWILVSSVITTWMSSAIVECYFAEKNCLILRPEGIEIPKNWDSLLYQNAESISTYREFQKEIHTALHCMEKRRFPISNEYIRLMYECSGEPVYRRMAALIEKYAERGRETGGRLDWNKKRVGYLFENHVCLKVLGKKVYQFAHKYFHYRITREKIREKYAVGLWESEAKQEKLNQKDAQNKIEILKKIVS